VVNDPSVEEADGVVSMVMALERAPLVAVMMGEAWDSSIGERPLESAKDRATDSPAPNHYLDVDLAALVGLDHGLAGLARA
jgi:hypothetical protein